MAHDDVLGAVVPTSRPFLRGARGLSREAEREATSRAWPCPRSRRRGDRVDRRAGESSCDATCSSPAERADADHQGPPRLDRAVVGLWAGTSRWKYDGPMSKNRAGTAALGFVGRPRAQIRQRAGARDTGEREAAFVAFMHEPLRIDRGLHPAGTNTPWRGGRARRAHRLDDLRPRSSHRRMRSQWRPPRGHDLDACP